MSNRIFSYDKDQIPEQSGGNGRRPEQNQERSVYPMADRQALETDATTKSTANKVLGQVTSLIRNKPAIAMGAAVATGLVLGFLAKRK